MRDYIVHLRLPFQYLLVPLFLWGFFLGRLAPGGQTDLGVFLLGFVAFHICLYGGGTAFNSYYDRDTGPIGALAHPPPVTRGLLPFALAVQAAGWVLSAGVSLALFLLYGSMFALSAAYSHPRVRLKAHPWTSILTIALGQGVGGFLGGWFVAGAPVFDLRGLLGLAIAVLVPTGFFPLTQVYQIEEDAARGDRTFAVAYGPRRVFQFCAGIWLAAGVLVIVLMALYFTIVEAVLFGLFVTAIAGGLLVWARRYDPREVMGNFKRVMLLSYIMSSGFLVYILARLWIGS